jgi:glycerophosphoryl diester phosphodiesterase
MRIIVADHRYAGRPRIGDRCAPALHLRLDLPSGPAASLKVMEIPATTRAPVVIAHRGAPGHLPEHTLESYRLAIAMGADYVEPDLVSTRDGVLVARHENEIGGTTDVADHPEFAGRRTRKWVDGTLVNGWFTEDFTLAELKTLRAKERLPQVRPANTAYDGRFEVPTFDEVLDLVRSETRRLGRAIGVYPETKHPTYFASIGLTLEPPLLDALARHDLDRPGSKVFLQSFEVSNLRWLRTMTSLPLVQLVDASGTPFDRVLADDPRSYRELVSPTGLFEVSAYADAVGVHKDLVLPRDDAGRATYPSRLVEQAHDAGLLVHVWTLRNEKQYMATNFRTAPHPAAPGDPYAEVHAFLEAGVDGLFTDHTDTAVAARTDWLRLEAVS